jgi:hypothetical protein
MLDEAIQLRREDIGEAIEKKDKLSQFIVADLVINLFALASAHAVNQRAHPRLSCSVDLCTRE